MTASKLTQEELFARVEKLGGCSGCGARDIVTTSAPEDGEPVRCWCERCSLSRPSTEDQYMIRPYRFPRGISRTGVENLLENH